MAVYDFLTLLRDRLMAGRRVLAPLIQVRVLVSQPFYLKGMALKSTCLFFINSYPFIFLMKYINSNVIEYLPGKRIDTKTSFNFQCDPDVSCFNLCCRNLNLFLYPYDVLRLKNNLNMTSSQFIDQYTDIVMREESYFPDVLLKMAENNEKTCPFLTESGCQVYPDRPDACRTFPIEMGIQYSEKSKQDEAIYFFRPPDFCKGTETKITWTLETWGIDQAVETYHRMTIQWAKLKRLFQNDPWGVEGINGKKGKMAFMALYNIDEFREFVFKSSFLKRYKIQKDLKNKMKKKDDQLLKLAFEWVKLFVWGLSSTKISIKQ